MPSTAIDDKPEDTALPRDGCTFHSGAPFQRIEILVLGKPCANALRGGVVKSRIRNKWVPNNRSILFAFPMHSENYLYLPSSIRSQFIYRIVSVRTSVRTVRIQTECIGKARQMGRSLRELYLEMSESDLPDGRYATIGFRDQFYGHVLGPCSATSDAMWRIYSPQSDAVRIRSTIQRVAASLWQYCGEWAPHEAFIGKVQYLPRKNLEKFAKGILRSGGGALSMRLFATTLLVKRPAFKHEREVRLIFTPHNKNNANKDMFAYPH